MKTKFKQYNIENISEYIENPEVELKIAKAILISLLKRNLISPQQKMNCIDELEVIFNKK